MPQPMAQIPVSQAKDSWPRRILERQVLQILVTYAVSCWGIIQFIDWLTHRYQLSPSLTDFVIVLEVLVFPSVLILAYYRGEPGKTPWTWAEKIGVPLNALVAALILWSSFQDKELGSINQTMMMQDAHGRTVQRTFPKSAFRKRIALFFFENQMVDQKLAWLRQGIPNLLAIDLSQDLFLDLHDTNDLADRIKKAGFSYKDPLALGLQRDLASYYRLPYILNGTFSKINNQFTLQVKIYETEHVKLIAKHNFQGTDLFDLIDQASLQVKRDLNIPEEHINSITDFPVTEISTRYLSALEHFTKSSNIRGFDENRLESIKELNQSLSIDPSFAIAYAFRFMDYYNSGKISQAKADLNQAKKYIFKLTEHGQFVLNSNSFFVSGQATERLKVLKQWSLLYPDDIQAYLRLAAYYINAAQPEEAIKSYRRVLELDPEQYTYLNDIGSLYENSGHYQEAIAAYQQYQSHVPNEATAYNNLGNIYLTMGQFELAHKYYQQALGIDSNNVYAWVGLGDIDLRLGNLSKALAIYQKTLTHSQLSIEKDTVYSSLDDYYRLTGQWQPVLALFPTRLTEKQKYSSTLSTQIWEAFYLDDYTKAGHPAQARAILDTIMATAKSDPLSYAIAQIGYLQFYIAQGDPERAEPLLPEIEKVLHDFGILEFAPLLLKSQGKIAELHKDYAKAILMYAEYLQKMPTEQLVHLDMGRCYRESKNYTQAETALKQALKYFPTHPEIHYELAQLYAATGEKAEARLEIQSTLKTWAHADKTYALAQKARVLASQLGKS